MSAGYNIIAAEELNEIFEENGLLYVEVLISVEESILQSDVIDRVRQVLSAFEDVNVTGFQPNSKYELVHYICMSANYP